VRHKLTASRFRNPLEYRGAVLYWTFRLLAVTLALELATLTTGSGLDGAEVWATQGRLVNYLLMSWQYAKSKGLPATVDVFQGYLVVWAGLFQRMSFKGLSIDAVKGWLMPKMRHDYIGWTKTATQREYDFAADILMGGPLAQNASAHRPTLKLACCSQWQVLSDRW